MPQLFRGSANLDGLPQTTKSGIYYEIESLSYREVWAPGANATTVIVRVPGEQSWDFVTDMVGQANGATGVPLRRDTPEQNPFDQKQYCTRVEQVDQGGDPNFDYDSYGVDPSSTNEGPRADGENGWPLTLWVRYKCTFEGFPFYVRTDDEIDQLAADNPTWTPKELLRYVTRVRRVTTKEQQFPGGSFTIIGDTKPLMQTGFKLRPAAEVQYVWHRVPVANMPIANMVASVGKINSAAFDVITPDGYNWAAGELLYSGFDDTNRYFDANEDWVCDLVQNFKWLKGGWNFYLNASAALVEVSSNGTSGGSRPYTTESFINLFETV